MGSNFNILLVLTTLATSATITTTASSISASQGNQVARKLTIYPHKKDEYPSSYWFAKNKKMVEQVASRPINKGRAKNVVFFLGDGMSLVTLTAARIYKGQQNGDSGEEGNLFFESFPNFSPIKTYNMDRQVPDSAGTATTFLSGVKANFEVIGCNANVASDEINCDKMKEHSVSSILQWAIDAGKAAGLVTNTRITHATPAASYAHVAHRNWEDDSALPTNLTGSSCKDIARQLIEDEPGKSLSVILGGGARHFYPNISSIKERATTPAFGRRSDGRNLVDEWIKGKEQQFNKNQFAFVDKAYQLKKAAQDASVVSLFGLFNSSHLSFQAERSKLGDSLEPSLVEMVESAIKVLKRADKGNGWVLFVEGGRIDHAHHQNQANLALTETLSLDLAVKSAVDSTDADETLVMVTADHAHTLTMNGYPKRGTKIIGGHTTYEGHGFNNSDVTYPVLMYGNGPGHQADGNNLNLENSESEFWKSHSAVYIAESAHGGEDVGLYATGPWAHLFTGLQDQSYIPHAAAYASCIGEYKSGKHCHPNSKNGVYKSPVPLVSLIFIFICQVISIIYI